MHGGVVLGRALMKVATRSSMAAMANNVLMGANVQPESVRLMTMNSHAQNTTTSEHITTREGIKAKYGMEWDDLQLLRYQYRMY